MPVRHRASTARASARPTTPPLGRRSLRRVGVAAAVVAGSAAISIQTAASTSAVSQDLQSAPEVRRVTVTPVDRVELRVDERPVEALETALVARYELLATALPEPEPEPEASPSSREADEFTSGSSAADEGSEAADDGSAGADEEPAASGDGGEGAAAAATNNVSLETWEAVARCESGYGGEPDWSINTGNGYYGGLQFNLDSWRWVGGTGYPHEASKATQIEMAERLWERQGWNAWPACSSQLGLR